MSISKINKNRTIILCKFSLDFFVKVWYIIIVKRKGKATPQKGKEVKAMSEYREQLVDRMIHIYGYENEIVIKFCEICEKDPDNAELDKMCELFVSSHEQFPQIENAE